MESQERFQTLAVEIEALIGGGAVERLRELVLAMHPADIAETLDELSPEASVIVFALLPDGIASEVLDETSSLVRQELVEQVDEERLADLLNELPMDDAAEFLEDLPEQTAGRLLSLMEPEEAVDVRELLSYSNETAGRLMTSEVAVLRPHWTVAETLEYLRSLEQAETLHYLYVVDEARRLVGVVPLRALVLTRPQQRIERVMVTDVVAIPVDIDQEELAETVSKYDYFAIPVVDHENRLLGVVTVDDVLDVLEEEVTEDIQRLGGSQPLAQPYFAVSTMQLVRKRIVWLLLLYVASLATDAVIVGFETTIAALAGLITFMPVILQTGGNAGSQTVTTIIRAMAVGELRLADLGRALRREMLVGLLLGVILSIFGFVRASLFVDGVLVPIVLTITLPLVLVWATTVATIVPVLAERLRIDPAVVSTPMITSFVDATGLLIYFTVAQWLLQL